MTAAGAGFDVAIVGSGVSGALVAAQLAARGARVLVLEAGPRVERGAAVQRFGQALVKVPESAYELSSFSPHPQSDRPGDFYLQAGPDPFGSTYLKAVGGTTWHWLGTAVRLVPDDFRMASRFGVARDWPVGYDSLEPWYARAEAELGVAGDDAADLGVPRSSGYPMPAIAPSYLDGVLRGALQGLFTVCTTPQARNSVAHADRPACCGSASCIPVCPIGAKYDAGVHVARAEGAGARVQDRTVVTRIRVDGAGQVAGLEWRRPDGSTGLATARHYVLAANAIETPRLLLASATGALPHGVANRSDQVGRNLMDHPVQLSWALSRSPVWPYRGPLSTSGIESLRWRGGRRTRSALRIEIGNDGWSWPAGAPMSTAAALARAGLRGEPLGAALQHQAARHLRLASLTEQLPEPGNRVTLDTRRRDGSGLPLPRVSYRLGSYVRGALAEARQVHRSIFERTGVSEMHHAPEAFGAGHILGTVAMGRSARNAVVDADLRSHDHLNLWLVGGGVFPTVGTGNPTLTIAALALRLADRLQAELAS